MPWIFRPAIVLWLLLAIGCAPSPRQTSIAVAPLSIGKKYDFIRQTKTTLQNFQLAAIDLRHRHKPKLLHEFAGEVKNYIALQVEPIIADHAASHNLATRLDIAQLQLLGSLLYIELKEYGEARRLLEKIEDRYGEQPDILTATLDRHDHGFASLGEGLQTLRTRIENEKGKPGEAWFPFLPILPRS